MPKIILIVVLSALAYLAVDHWVAPEKPVSKPIVNPVKSVSVGVVVKKVQSLKELHTGSAWIQTVVAYEEKNEVLGIPVGSAKMMYVAFGEVRAGVDLSELDDNQIWMNKDTIRVRLPAVKILDSKIDVDQSFVYDVRTSLILAPDTTLLQSDAERVALKKIVETAVEEGLLDVATENAVDVVRELLEGFVMGKDVIVEIE